MNKEQLNRATNRIYWYCELAREIDKLTKSIESKQTKKEVK